MLIDAAEQPSSPARLADNLRLQQQVDALTVQVADLQAQLVALQAQLAAALAEVEGLRRRNARQAAPFSTGKRKQDPQKPGRKPGQGRFTGRKAPAAETFTDQIAVPAPEGGCPQCGGFLEQVGTETVTRTDLPPPPPPPVTAYAIPICRCQQCGGTVRGQHPDVPADQRGATAHRVGAEVYACAHWLHYGLGVPVRKVPQILWQLRGVKITQSALTQAALRQAAGPVGQAYTDLREAVRTRPQVHTDDTGWKVGGATAHLMGFETPQERVYQIRPQHRNEEVRELVPGDYAGILITDRGRSYDAQALAGVRQQKCLDHLDRSILKVLAGVQGEDRQLPEQLRALFWTARHLWKTQQQGATPDFGAECARLETALGALLALPTPPLHPENEKLRHGLAWQHERGHLLRFLHVPGVEPTNNRAERLLRPAVIARKVSQCSKTERGANAFSAFASLFGSLALRGIEAVGGVLGVLRTGRLPEAPT